MFTLASFTPSKTAELTGLSPTQQKDWRRRGLLPAPPNGHARFSPFDVAELLVMRELADRGVGPAVSGEMAKYAALGVMYYALDYTDAYEGEHLRTFEWVPEDERPKGEMDPEIRKQFEDRGLKLPQPLGISWVAQRLWLSTRILRHRRMRFVPAQFLVWWADGTYTFEKSLDEAFSDVTTTPKYDGPVITRDIQVLASMLIERAGPLVRVEYQKDRMGNVLPPDPELEYGPIVPLRVNAGAEK